MKDAVRIGKIVAAHGVQGDMILLHNLGKKTSLPGLKKIFVEQAPGSFLPYFVLKAKVKSETETILSLEGVDTKEKVKILMPRYVWFMEEDFNTQSQSNAPISLLGYTLVHNKENLGEIVEVVEQPHQILCSIDYKGKEALIPVHADNLQKIDHRQKKVYVLVPDGLLELYSS